MDDKLPAAWQKNQVITASLKPLSLKVAQTPPNEWGLYDMCGNVGGMVSGLVWALYRQGTD